MINKRLDFVKKMGMEEFDKFDISLITDKIRTKKISSKNGINTYEVDNESGIKCFYKKDKNGVIVEYGTNYNDNYYIINNNSRSFKLGDVEVIEEPIDDDHLLYKKFVMGELIDSYKICIKDNHSIKMFNENIYLVEYSYTSDDITYIVSMNISKEDYDNLDMSNLEDVVPAGQWITDSFFSDGRPLMQVSSTLLYKRYFYNDDKELIGFISMDPILDKIIEICKTENGFLYNQTSVVKDSGNISMFGNEYNIDIPMEKKSIIYNDSFINSISINEIDNNRVLVTTKFGEYESYIDKSVIYNKYDHNAFSKYVDINSNNYILHCNTLNGEMVTVCEDNKISKFIKSNTGTHNMMCINNDSYTNYFVDGVEYKDMYTEMDILNENMVVYRLNGVINKINVISKDSSSNKLEESFIFSLDGSMVSIIQKFYHNNILFIENIINK